MGEPTYVSTKIVERMTGLKASSIACLVRRHIFAGKKVGTKWMVDQESVRQAMAEGKVGRPKVRRKVKGNGTDFAPSSDCEKAYVAATVSCLSQAGMGADEVRKMIQSIRTTARIIMETQGT